MSSLSNHTGPRIRALPVAWVTTCRSCLIAGGGYETGARVRHALECDWVHIHLVMPLIPPDLRALRRTDLRLELHERRVQEDDIAHADLVFEDTGDPTLAVRIRDWCDEHGKPLNACDKPDLCDLYYMSLLTRGPLTIGISSGGDAPAVAASMRRWMEEHLGPGWAMAATVMAETRKSLPGGHARMDLLKRIARHDRFLPLVLENDEAGLRSLISDVVRCM